MEPLLLPFGILTSLAAGALVALDGPLLARNERRTRDSGTSWRRDRG